MAGGGVVDPGVARGVPELEELEDNVSGPTEDSLGVPAGS